VTLHPDDANLLANVRKDVQAAEKALDAHLLARAYIVRTAAHNGATMREIAEAVGISHQRVAQILNAGAQS